VAYVYVLLDEIKIIDLRWPWRFNATGTA